MKKLILGLTLGSTGIIAVCSPLSAQPARPIPIVLSQIAQQTSDEDLPRLFPASPRSPEAPSEADRIVELNLPDLISIVVRGNRDLQNSLLERVVQRQTLEEQESVFDPQLTPRASIRADRTFSDSGIISEVIGPDGELETFDRRGDSTRFSERLELFSTLRTPLGTELELSVAPLTDASRVDLNISQPLLRGAGQAVNRAPVRQARITESNNVLALRQEVIDTITTSILQYTTLVQRQEAVDIQAQALERRRQQFEIVSALVEAGRQARVELVNSERSIAEAELALQDAQNQLSQANTDLLNLTGSEVAYQFIAPEDAIDLLFETAVRRAASFDLDALIQTAYTIRPDYQQAQAQLKIEDLNLLQARDNRRWSLDWESTARLDDDFSQAATGLRLERTFGDESLNTAIARSQTNILQQQNAIAQLEETIRNQVGDRLRDVNSGFAQVEAAQRATEAARLQLQVTQEKFALGRDGTTLFDITQQEENLVVAQNAELQSRISVLNSIAEIDRVTGTTIDSWRSLANLAPVLEEEQLSEEQPSEEQPSEE
ncbi:MAG: TolC family protein [Cyanobacteria bacterium J06606_4]